MGGRTLWNTKAGRIIQETKSAGCGQVTWWTRMIAGAIVGAVLLIETMVAPLCAQSYPSKPIRLIIGMAPGGATDILGRIITQKLTEQLGQPAVPENRGGAGGNIAYEFAAKVARPDGYTIVLGAPGLVINSSLYRKFNYDPIKDFTPISLVAQNRVALFIRPSLPVKNLRELVEYAKANPGKLTFGSPGIGSPNHLAVELFKSLAKIDLVHVPYKGGGPAMIGLISGETDMQVTAPETAQSQIQAGKVRVLAALSNERLPSLPDVPTAKESGIDNLEVTVWYGILAPVGTPRDIVNRLNAEWNNIAAKPSTKEQLQKVSFETLSSTPEDFSEFLKAETVRWAKVIKEANIPKID